MQKYGFASFISLCSFNLMGSALGGEDSWRLLVTSVDVM
jgi:hypothetical protein